MAACAAANSKKPAQGRFAMPESIEAQPVAGCRARESPSTI
jgi:hypothetical protein